MKKPKDWRKGRGSACGGMCNGAYEETRFRYRVPASVTVWSNTFKPHEAQRLRDLAAWCMRAADWLESKQEPRP